MFKEIVLFIDIKSEDLYNILWDILYDIKAVNLIKDKLSVIKTGLLLKNILI